jgi:hypothetical protein
LISAYRQGWRKVTSLRNIAHIILEERNVLKRLYALPWYVALYIDSFHSETDGIANIILAMDAYGNASMEQSWKSK